MQPTISANDLKPGDRVVLRMQKARHGPIPLPARFEQFHDAASLATKMVQPGNLILPGKWEEALQSCQRLATFRIGILVGVFRIDEDGRLWDEEAREIEIVLKDRL